MNHIRKERGRIWGLKMMLCWAGVAALLGCGGGGGGGGAASGPAASTASFPFRSAWAAYQTTPIASNFTLTGTASSSSLGASYPLTGSGTMVQTVGTAVRPDLNGLGGSVTAIAVTRAYTYTGTANSVSVSGSYTDVAWYDPGSYVYMGGLRPTARAPPSTTCWCSGSTPCPRRSRVAPLSMAMRILL